MKYENIIIISSAILIIILITVIFAINKINITEMILISLLVVLIGFVLISLYNMNKKLNTLTTIAKLSWQEQYLNKIEKDNNNFEFESDFKFYKIKKINEVMYERQDIELIMKKINEDNYKNIFIPKVKALNFVNKKADDKNVTFKFKDNNDETTYIIETYKESDKYRFVEITIE